jgi:transcriptional regulator with XRE-family HTH domain
MFLGDRLRIIRESKQMSQGDIEKRTAMLRCYLSRVECGHTVPSVETLESGLRRLGFPCTSFSTRERGSRIYPN